MFTLFPLTTYCSHTMLLLNKIINVLFRLQYLKAERFPIYVKKITKTGKLNYLTP